MNYHDILDRKTREYCGYTFDESVNKVPNNVLHKIIYSAMDEVAQIAKDSVSANTATTTFGEVFVSEAPKKRAVRTKSETAPAKKRSAKK